MVWLWLASQGGTHRQWGSSLSVGSRLLVVIDAKLGIVGRYPMRTLECLFDSASLLCTFAVWVRGPRNVGRGEPPQPNKYVQLKRKRVY
ncbi:hypothetical protein N9L68_07755 [bacterium]|nr:hypothetical protein [bacterium]